MGKRQIFDLGTVVPNGHSEEADLSQFTEAVAYLTWAPTATGSDPYVVRVCWEYNPSPLGQTGNWYRQYSFDQGQFYPYTTTTGVQSDYPAAVPLAGLSLGIDCPSSNFGANAPTSWNGQYTLDAKTPRRVRLACIQSGTSTPFKLVLEAHQRRRTR